LSGRTTFIRERIVSGRRDSAVAERREMTEFADQHPREDNRNEEVEGSPIPDPEEEDTTAEDDPQAD
jgi:hypothetical protein